MCFDMMRAKAGIANALVYTKNNSAAQNINNKIFQLAKFGICGGKGDIPDGLQPDFNNANIVEPSIAGNGTTSQMGSDPIPRPVTSPDGVALVARPRAQSGLERSAAEVYVAHRVRAPFDAAFDSDLPARPIEGDRGAWVGGEGVQGHRHCSITTRLGHSIILPKYVLACHEDCMTICNTIDVGFNQFQLGSIRTNQE